MTYPTITKIFDYPRPYLEMPNPKSTKGNPIEYFPLALECLKKSGFYKEYHEMMHYSKAIPISHDKIIFQIPYQEQMNFLSHFLDIDTTSYLQEETLENSLDNSNENNENNENFYYIKKRKIELPCPKGHGFLLHWKQPLSSLKLFSSKILVLHFLHKP
jgi:hypothetical protein